VSRRASLPGADELFRRTSTGRAPSERSRTEPEAEDDKSTKLQVAKSPPREADVGDKKVPKHEEKITFYCTRDDLMALEATRLKLRAEYGAGADRGRIVRAALGYVLEDFEARGEDSILLRRLAE
jgi:hypothetical protein